MTCVAGFPRARPAQTVGGPPHAQGTGPLRAGSPELHTQIQLTTASGLKPADDRQGSEAGMPKWGASFQGGVMPSVLIILQAELPGLLVLLYSSSGMIEGAAWASCALLGPVRSEV